MMAGRTVKRLSKILPIAMRVISGEYGGRRLRTVSGLDVRPTSDRLRETLFNILASRVEGARFLDLCAGSGAVGIEALSRGAVDVTFIDRSPRAVSVIKSNLIAIGIPMAEQSPARILQGDAPALIARLNKQGEKFDVVFLDPPYDSGLYEHVMTQLGRGLVLARQPIVIVEHRVKSSPSKFYGKLEMYRTLKQGESALSMFGME
jgi:16S rRNA (guanine966-N2)-methyltransferase